MLCNFSKKEARVDGWAWACGCVDVDVDTDMEHGYNLLMKDIKP